MFRWKWMDSSYHKPISSCLPLICLHRLYHLYTTYLPSSFQAHLVFAFCRFYHILWCFGRVLSWLDFTYHFPPHQEAHSFSIKSSGLFTWFNREYNVLTSVYNNSTGFYDYIDFEVYDYSNGYPIGVEVQYGFKF